MKSYPLSCSRPNGLHHGHSSKFYSSLRLLPQLTSHNFLSLDLADLPPCNAVGRVSSKGGGGGGGGGGQGKLPPQTAQLPPQTDPTSPPKILPIIIIMKSTLPLPWPYSHMIRELPPQDEIPR